MKNRQLARWNLGLSVARAVALTLACAASPAAASQPSATAPPDSGFSTVIAPILQNKCSACHGGDRKKGGLSLASPDAIMAGGDSGPIIAIENSKVKPADSEILRRLKLPLDDEDHMPPSAKAQLTAEELAAIETWVTKGASFTAPASELPAVPKSVASAAPAEQIPLPAPAPAAAIEALRKALVHVEPVSQGSPLLIVNASAVARSIDDAAASTFFEPMLDQIADLTLARTRITDATLAIVARMPNLTRLNLSGSPVTDAGLAKVCKLGRLEELVVTQTPLSDASIDTIAGIKTLKRVYVWKTKLTPDGIAALRKKLKHATIDSGDTPAATALDAEREVKFTSDAPAPGAGSAATADALKPINTVCPVSGKPVDTNYALVYKGRVVGFCCRHCVAQFLEDPSKFEGKIAAK